MILGDVNLMFHASPMALYGCPDVSGQDAILSASGGRRGWARFSVSELAGFGQMIGF